MRRIKKKTVIIILIVLGAILFVKWYGNPERRIFAMVERNQEKYEATVAQLLNGEVAADELYVLGVHDIDIIMGEHVMVDFFVTGFGLVPSSTYYGFYYSPEDLPLMHMDEMAKLTEYEEGAWKWQGVGDNGGIVKKITDCWYYYEASF